MCSDEATSKLTHLLDRRRLLETVRVDAAEKFLPQLHRIEGLDALIPVRLDVILGERLVASVAPRSLVPELAEQRRQRMRSGRTIHGHGRNATASTRRSKRPAFAVAAIEMRMQGKLVFVWPAFSLSLIHI